MVVTNSNASASDPSSLTSPASGGGGRVAFRQSLRANVAAACSRAGFETAEKVAVETLVELLQGYISETARSTQLFCEHGGRTNPTYCDVIVALANIGFPLNSLLEFLNETKQEQVGIVSHNLESTNTTPILQVGTKKKFPFYVNDTFNYPELPDPHTYIRTTTGVNPESDYVILRERSATCKRDVERALTQFEARTNRSLPLLAAINSGEYRYSLVEANPAPDLYLESLLPSQEDLVRIRDFDEESNKNQQQKNEDKNSTTAKNPQQQRQGGDDKTSPPDNPSPANKSNDDVMTSPQMTSRIRRDTSSSQQQQTSQRSGGGGGAPNNPYLRPVKRTRQHLHHKKKHQRRIM